MRRRRLRQRFGPEYYRLAGERDSKRNAEAELTQRESTTASRRSSRSSKTSRIRCYPPGMARTQEPRNCAPRFSITARSGTVSRISPEQL
jgi:hypothetical protein